VDNFQRRHAELPSVIVMKATIRVDAATLRGLGSELVAIAKQLDADAEGLGEGVADPCLASALEDVQHDWSKKRKIITGYLNGAGKAAQDAADSYQRTDRAIVCAATAGAATASVATTGAAKPGAAK
jgi:hypothetical protein